jgi:hypothetical protein
MLVEWCRLPSVLRFHAASSNEKTYDFTSVQAMFTHYLYTIRAWAAQRSEEVVAPEKLTT